MTDPREHPLHWRAREREWVWFAACLAAFSALFALWPQIDLIAARLMHGPSGFRGHELVFVQVVYHSVPWLSRGIFVVALIIACLAWRARRRAPPRWRRRILLLGLSLLLGTGLVVNGALKEGWGRARPVAVQELGGKATFAPAFRPTDQCRTNCSFVSGHAASGFALGAVGLLSAPAVRRRWLMVGLIGGTVVGLVRMSQGAHFLSDIVFSGIAMWACHLAIRAVWLRVAALRTRREVSPA